MDTVSLPSVPTMLLILIIGIVIYLEYKGISIIRRLYTTIYSLLINSTNVGSTSNTTNNNQSSSSSSITISTTGGINPSTGTAIDIENGNNTPNSSLNTGASAWDLDDKKGPNLIGLSTTEQPLLSNQQIKLLMSHLPSKCHGRDWTLLFSTSRDGYSLSTLYSRVQNKGPTLVIVMDDQSYIFGGFASRDWNGTDLITGSIAFSSTANGMDILSPSRKAVQELNNVNSSSSSFSLPSSHSVQGSYFGSGESFLFTSRPNFAVYRWTRKNNLFLLHRPDCLAFGGGGSRFGLYLDSTLERGASGTCETFANTPLASSELFRIVRVEVWGFTLPLHLQNNLRSTTSTMAAGIKAQVQSAKQLLSLGNTSNTIKYDKINK